MTNEEKIKAMSREELAEFMADFYHDGACFADPPYCKEPCTKPVDYPCRHCVEEWLGEEADGYRQELREGEEGGH